MPTFATPIDGISTTVAVARSTGSTSLTVASSAGMGTPTPDNPVRITCVPKNTTNRVHFYVTGVSGTNWTISAPIDGYSDLALPVGSTVKVLVSAGTILELQTAILDVPSGPQGYQGSQGSTGLQGQAGLQGYQGSQGQTGAGVQGATGSQGYQGSVGLQGVQGATGTGSQGYQGFQGYQGSGGLQGSQGAAGTGSQGSQGQAGSNGLQGQAGSQGYQGFQGSAGTQGPQGRQGFQGFQGSNGTNGSQGYQGYQGFQGQTGAGVQGATGFQGFQGSQGATGTGTQGYQGSQGNQGGSGSQGYQGAAGSGGSPGGSQYQIQYNTGSALGGLTGSTVNPTDGSITLTQPSGIFGNPTLNILGPVYNDAVNLINVNPDNNAGTTFQVTGSGQTQITGNVNNRYVESLVVTAGQSYGTGIRIAASGSKGFQCDNANGFNGIGIQVSSNGFLSNNPTIMATNTNTSEVLICNATAGGTLAKFQINATDTTIIDSTGKITAPGMLIHPTSGSTVGLTVKGNQADSEDLLELQDSGGNILAKVGPQGEITTTSGLNVANRVGIGNTSPSYGLHQTGGSARLQALVAPTTTIANVGTAGSTTWYYWTVIEDFGGGYTLLSADSHTSTSNATLSGTNYNSITFDRVPGAYKYYLVRASSNTLDPGWYIDSSEAVVGTVLDDGTSSTYTINDQSNTLSTTILDSTSRNSTADFTVDGQMTIGAASTNTGNYTTVQINSCAEGNNQQNIFQVCDNTGTVLAGFDPIGCMFTLGTSGPPGPDALTSSSFQWDFEAGILYGWTSDGWQPIQSGFTPNVQVQYSAQHWFGQTTLTDGSTISWDLNPNQATSVTLGGNRTLANPTNMQAGLTATLIVKQDSTGSRTLGYGTDYKWAGGTAPTLSTAANAVDILTFLSDGTYMYGTFAKGFA